MWRRYLTLDDELNIWYDSINDVHNNNMRHDYFYVYLSCINEVNDEVE